MKRVIIKKSDEFLTDFTAGDIDFNLTLGATQLYHSLAKEDTLEVSTMEIDKTKARGVLKLSKDTDTKSITRYIYETPDILSKIGLCRDKLEEVLGHVPEEIYIL